MKHRRRHTIAAVAFCLLLVAPPAGASETSAAEVADLARRAAEDPAALEQLREIDVVDGRDMDLDAVLATDDETALRARLETLARLSGPEVPQDFGAEAAAAAAAEILEHPRYHTQDAHPSTTSPSESDGGPVEEPATGKGSNIVGVLVAAVALLAFLAAVVGAVYLLARRRTHVGPGKAKPAPGKALETAGPGELERLAAEAETHGRFADALRYRFRAGLLRLDAAGRIRLQPWSTGRQVAAALSSEPFNRILSTFEPVVYGDRVAVDRDATSARRDWQQVLGRP